MKTSVRLKGAGIGSTTLNLTSGAPDRHGR